MDQKYVPKNYWKVVQELFFSFPYATTPIYFAVLILYCNMYL